MFSAKLQEGLALSIVGIVFTLWAQRQVRRAVFPGLAAWLLKRGRVGAAMWFRARSLGR